MFDLKTINGVVKFDNILQEKDTVHTINQYGEYWKLPSGLVIETINKPLTTPCSTQYGSVYISATVSFVIPYDFKTCLYAKASMHSDGGATSTHETYVDFGVMKVMTKLSNPTSWPACNGTISFLLIGTWK